MKLIIALGAALFTTALSTAAPQARGVTIQINEIRLDQPGSDSDEYFELWSSSASTSLDGLTYVVLGDGASAAGSGVIEAVIDLTGLTTDLDGFFLATESSFTLPGTADLVASINFENGDNFTHLLVEGFTGSNGDDLDVGDDGVLEILPWNSVVDGVGVVRELGNPSYDLVYSGQFGLPNVGPDGSFSPGHAFRCDSGWRIGLYDPAGGSDTPGELNANCVGTTSAFCDPGAANEFSATGGKMGFTGSFSVQANDTVLTATDIPNNFGLFVQSDMIAAATTAPIGGNVCVTGPNIIRLNVILLASNNQTSLALDIDPMSGTNEAGFGVMPGMTLYYQMFHRDSTFAGGGNWTNGLAATWTL